LTEFARLRRHAALDVLQQRLVHMQEEISNAVMTKSKSLTEFDRLRRHAALDVLQQRLVHLQGGCHYKIGTRYNTN
jgi:hypothetical protein